MAQLSHRRHPLADQESAYAAINILGLAMGMAACLMILLFVRYEFSYDKWLPGSENLYQLQSWYKAGETGGDDQLQMTSIPSGPALAKDFPQVERWVYAFQSEPVFVREGQVATLKDFLYTADDLLKVLPLPLVKGDSRALAQPGTAVITQSEAVARFGTEDVVGKTLSVISRGKHRDFRITGLLKDIPRNSHLKINVIARIDLNAFFADTPDNLECWGCQNGWIWVKLKPGADAKAIEAQFPAWEKRNIPDQSSGEARFNAGDDQDWRLVNVKDIHLGEGQGGAMTPGNDQRTIVTFAVIALLILGTAIVNFTNLATARAGQRAREVALRKVLGANRQQLISQFIGELVLIATLAMVLALAFVELLMPSLAKFLEADIPVHYLGSGGILLPVVVLTLAVGVLSGLYPAFFLALPARDGAQGQQIHRRGLWHGPDQEHPGGRPVRGFDWPDHLHGGDLPPDRLRPHRGPRLQARPHSAGRRAEPLPTPEDGRDDSGADRARARRQGRRPHRHRYRDHE